MFITYVPILFFCISHNIFKFIIEILINIDKFIFLLIMFSKIYFLLDGILFSIKNSQ